MTTEFDPWPEGYGLYTVKTVDGVTLIRPNGDDRAIIFLTDAGGLKVCVDVHAGDLLGIARQIVAHVAPTEILQKNLVVISGGKAA